MWYRGRFALMADGGGRIMKWGMKTQPTPTLPMCAHRATPAT